jgi:hypothetical protein
MSGALKGVFGGGGIFGALMSIASIAFPPLAIANSLGNMLLQGIGQAIGQAVQTLIKESGMPKFLGGVIGNLVDQVLGGQKKETDPQADSLVQSNEGVQDWMQKFQKDLSNQIVESSRKHIEKDKASGAGGKGGKGGVSSGSWLQAIAAAMGEVLGDKAAKMVTLADKMSALNSDGKAISTDPKDEKAQAARQENAREFSKTQTEFQAVSQEFSLLQSTFSNAIKSIGEGLAQMGRKG